MIPGQLDALDLLAAAAPVPTGPVEGFGLDLTPEALAELHDQWRATYGDLRGEHWRPWRGWRLDPTSINAGADHPHASGVYTADLRPARIFRALVAEREQIRTTLQGVGGYYHRVWCDGCQWWSQVYETEAESVTEYLNHCWPGWENLPVLCQGKNPQKPRYTVPADYPEAWMTPGAPWRDCRHNQYATRSHNAADGPFGQAGTGYSVGVINPECPHYQHPHH